MDTVRQRLAILILCVWGLGVELAPGLHVALHDLLAHHHHHDGGHDASPNGDPDHGRDSLAHKQVAWTGPPPPIVPPAVQLAGAIQPPDAPPERPPLHLAVTYHARGPPGA